MQGYLGVLGAIAAVMLIFFAYAARELVLIREEIGALRQDVARVDTRVDRLCRGQPAEETLLP